MQKLKELIIISNENISKAPIYTKKLEVNEPFLLSLIDYYNNFGVSYNGLTMDDSEYMWYKRLSELGYLIIEKNISITFYLPEIISNYQYRYLLENKKGISDYIRNSDMEKLVITDKNISLEKAKEEEIITSLYNEIRKRYISIPNSSVSIIPNEDKMTGMGNFYYEFDHNILDSHAQVFKVFCMRNFIPLSRDNSGYYYGKVLAQDGFLSICKENDEIYILIPNELSNNQLKWLFDNRKDMEKYNYIEIGIYNENAIFKELMCNSIKSRYDIIDFLNKFYQDLEKEKVKKKTKEL